MMMIFSPCSFSALSCSILVPCLSQSPGISPDVFLLSLVSLSSPPPFSPFQLCETPRSPHTGGVPAVPGRAVRESPPAAPIHSVTNNQERKGHRERPSFGDGRGHAAGCGTLPLLHFPAPPGSCSWGCHPEPLGAIPGPSSAPCPAQTAPVPAAASPSRRHRRCSACPCSHLCPEGPRTWVGDPRPQGRHGATQVWVSTGTCAWWQLGGCLSPFSRRSLGCGRELWLPAIPCCGFWS